MLDAPIFTSPLDPDIAGDDPLGLAPMNERLYNAVFPGINNVVRYIRVYSSICWMVNQVDEYFAKHSKELSKGEAIQLANDAYEKLQLVLTWVNQGKGYTQLAGIGRQFPQNDQKIKLVFETFGTSTVSLLEAVAYRPSLTTGLGFLERKLDGTFACTEAGLALAKAFGEHVKLNEKYKWLANVTHLEARRSSVFELESVFDVSTATEAERAAFISQFFPCHDMVKHDQPSQNRWLALHLTLRAVQAVCRANRAGGDSALASEQEVRACMARCRTNNGKQLECKDVETVQVWWSILQLRQLHRLALDTLFGATEQWLADRDMETFSVSLATCAEALGQSVTSELHEDYQNKVSDLHAYFVEGQGGNPTLYAAASAAGADESVDLFQHVGELRNIAFNFDEDGGNEAVSSAYIALIFCATEVENLLKDPLSKDALLRDQDQCSMMSLAKLVGRMRDSSPATFISNLIRHWVILRHFQIVCDRSQNADGKNRFRFVLGENGLERFNPALGIVRPAFAQDKLLHMLLLCHQSGLVDEKDGNYKLTPVGRARLQELA